MRAKCGSSIIFIVLRNVDDNFTTKKKLIKWNKTHQQNYKRQRICPIDSKHQSKKKKKEGKKPTHIQKKNTHTYIWYNLTKSLNRIPGLSKFYFHFFLFVCALVLSKTYIERFSHFIESFHIRTNETKQKRSTKTRPIHLFLRYFSMFVYFINAIFRICMKRIKNTLFYGMCFTIEKEREFFLDVPSSPLLSVNENSTSLLLMKNQTE